MKNNFKFKHMSYLFFLFYIFFGLTPCIHSQQSKTTRQVKNNHAQQSDTKKSSHIKKNTKDLTENTETDVDHLATSLNELTVEEAETVVLPNGQTRAKKEWNFIVYMVNNNNLHKYGVKNFKQMAKVGSTKTINLLIQMDDLGTSDIKRYYIEKNDPVAIDSDTFVGSTISGTPENLFEFV